MTSIDTTTETIVGQGHAYLADLYDAFATGDASAWTDRLSRQHEPVVIGTDPAEFWDDRDHLVETTRAQAAAMAASGVRLVAGSPRIAAASDTVWIADEPRMVLADGRQIRMRLTAVLVREEGELRLAQAHLSVGHANEDMLDLALPV